MTKTHRLWHQPNKPPQRIGSPVIVDGRVYLQLTDRAYDVVVNGLPAYWNGMGQATGSYLAGLFTGERRWRDVLTGMAVDLPWQHGYDPMRAVNGELDNRYDPAAGHVTVTPR